MTNVIFKAREDLNQLCHYNNYIQYHHVILYIAQCINNKVIILENFLCQSFIVGFQHLHYSFIPFFNSFCPLLSKSFRPF